MENFSPSIVINQCSKLEETLRIIDGQDPAASFDGRMKHREMALALTKLDEVRLWVHEHLRIRAMVAEAQLQAETKRIVDAWETQDKAHASDCATNNAPALPVGPCDCSELHSTVRVKAAVQYGCAPADEYSSSAIQRLCTNGEADDDENGDVPLPPAGYRWRFEGFAGKAWRYLVKEEAA